MAPAAGSAAPSRPVALSPRLLIPATAAGRALRAEQARDTAQRLIVTVRPGTDASAALEATTAPVTVLPLGGDTYTLQLPRGAGVDRLPAGRAGVKVALIDTGYAFRAPSFDTTGAIVPGYDYADHDPDPTDHGTPLDPTVPGSPLVSHGTWVANVMRAQADNGNQMTGALRTLPSTVVVYKVFTDAGDGPVSALIAAIRGAADAGCKVINISLGIPASSAGSPEVAQLQDAVNYANGKGAVIIAAAGNYTFPESHDVWFPARLPGVLAVSAVDPSSGSSQPRSPFSCYGPQIALCAPGQSVVAVGLDGTVDYVDGTSFSAPLASASAALVWSLAPGVSPATVRSALELSAHTVGSPSDAVFYGHGLVDVSAAWTRLANATAPQPQPLSLATATGPGRTVTLSWPAPTSGVNVRYRYGWDGGDVRSTTARSAQVVLPADGTYTLFVEASSDDHRGGTAITRGVDVGNGTAALPTTRAEDSDRYGTAAAVSCLGWSAGATSCVVASGEDWPDALTAAPLARKIGGPLLLTRGTSLPYVTRDEIRRLFAAAAGRVTVYVVGGTGAVSPGVVSEIEFAATGHATTIERLAGTTRYDTAAAVAGALASSETTCVIASGETWPDALAAGPLAAAARWPILLVRSSGPPPAATVSAVAGLRTALVVGGTGVVASDTVDALPLIAPPGGRWIRVAGPDRQSTSRSVADWGAAIGVLTGTTLGVATSASFPDGLSAGPAAALEAAPVILASDAPNQLPALESWATARGSTTRALRVFGGTGAVSLGLQQDVQRALRLP